MEKLHFTYMQHCALAVWLSDRLAEEIHLKPTSPEGQQIFQTVFERMKTWPGGIFEEDPHTQNMKNKNG